MSDAKQEFIDEVMRLAAVKDNAYALKKFMHERISGPVRYQQTDGKMVHSFLQPTKDATDCIPLYRLDGGHKE